MTSDRAYLTTFERVMGAYEVKEERWAVKLAPQLTGKAQQAYAAMSTEQAGDYEALKEAILRRYDTSEETYRQRFRAATKKEDEVVSELVVRLNDLLQKWTKTCTSEGGTGAATELLTYGRSHMGRRA